MTMVDDAHATGIWRKGKGTSEYFGLKDAVDISMGTLSKAFGVEGDLLQERESLLIFYGTRPKALFTLLLRRLIIWLRR